MTAAAPTTAGDRAVTLATNTGPTSARCTGCTWQRDGMGSREWLMIRAAARRHTGSRGHTVVMTVGTVYTLGRVPRPRRTPCR